MTLGQSHPRQVWTAQNAAWVNVLLWSQLWLKGLPLGAGSGDHRGASGRASSSFLWETPMCELEEKNWRLQPCSISNNLVF